MAGTDLLSHTGIAANFMSDDSTFSFRKVCERMGLLFCEPKEPAAAHHPSVRQARLYGLEAVDSKNFRKRSQ